MAPVKVSEWTRFDGRQRFVLVAFGGCRLAVAPFRARELAAALVTEADRIAGRAWTPA